MANDYPDERDPSGGIEQYLSGEGDDPTLDLSGAMEKYLAQLATESDARANESKTRQVLAINAAMQQTADSLPGGPLSRVPGLSPLSPTAPPDARMYMGPNIPTQSVRDLVPPGMAFSAVTPPEVSNANYDRGVTSGLIQPPPPRRLMPTDVAWTPAYEQWAAQQDLKADVERGIPIEQAAIKHPEAFRGVSGIRSSMFGMTPAQAAANKIAEERLAISKTESERKSRQMWSPLDRITVDKNAERIALNQKNLDTLRRIPNPSEADIKGMQRLAREANLLRQENDAIAGKYVASPMTATGTATAAAPRGRPVTDRKGNKWLYTGTAADPKTDRDPSHWIAQ